jgi:hypothetical protein
MIIFELYNQRQVIQFPTEEIANSYLGTHNDRVQTEADLLTGQEKTDYLEANILELRSVEVEEIAPQPTPDWQGFLNANDVPPIGNGIFEELLAINLSLALDIYQLLLRLKDNQAILEIRTVNYLYGLLTPALPPDRLQLLKDTIVDNNIPIVI